MSNPTLVVVFDVESVGRRVIRETIGEAADILYLTDVPAAERADVLRRADVIFAQNTAKDLTTDELSLIRTVGCCSSTRLVSILSPCRTCRRIAPSPRTGVRSRNRWRSMRSP